MTTYNQLNAYRETNIKTAGQGRLIMMMYDGAINHLKKAIEFIPDGFKCYDDLNREIVKAQDIITELMVSLDFDKGEEIAKPLFSLYRFFNTQLMQANMQKDGEILHQVMIMMVDLRSTWGEISHQTLEKNNQSVGLSIST